MFYLQIRTLLVALMIVPSFSLPIPDRPTTDIFSRQLQVETWDQVFPRAKYDAKAKEALQMHLTHNRKRRWDDSALYDFLEQDQDHPTEHVRLVNERAIGSNPNLNQALGLVQARLDQVTREQDQRTKDLISAGHVLIVHGDRTPMTGRHDTQPPVNEPIRLPSFDNFPWPSWLPPPTLPPISSFKNPSTQPPQQPSPHRLPSSSSVPQHQLIPFNTLPSSSHPFPPFPPAHVSPPYPPSSQPLPQAPQIPHLVEQENAPEDVGASHRQGQPPPPHDPPAFGGLDRRPNSRLGKVMFKLSGQEGEQSLTPVIPKGQNTKRLKKESKWGKVTQGRGAGEPLILTHVSDAWKDAQGSSRS